MFNIISLIAFIPGLFGYPSAHQAKVACFEWAEKGPQVQVTYVEHRPSVRKATRWINSRKCTVEQSTNQWLGSQKLPNDGPWKIVKHFRY